MRVVTLLPAATEIVAAIGAGNRLAGISHECDYPADVLDLPRVTATPLDPSLPSAAIDAEVRRLREEGRPVIGVDAAQLRRLAPDLVVTQGLCEVCAVADGEVHRLARALSPAPRVLSLSARTVAGIFEDIGAVGRELGRVRQSAELIARLTDRLERLRADRPAHRPRVLCIEWLEPLYLAGHWVPELVDAAGGIDVGAEPGSHSSRRRWEDLDALEADVIVVMLCGFGPDRARQELSRVADAAARRVLAGSPVWILDGNAYTSRPGPRVVEGAERLRSMLEGCEAPGLVRWRCPWATP